jgi:CheY-like chemotaxis protein/two-component sensor histidine kinase
VSDADEQKKTEYLQRINESAKYLLGLINEVLDMSKIEREKMQLNYEPVQIDDFWRSTLPIIDEIAKQRGIDFDVKISGGELVIIADRQRMQQIAVNLLSNAVKFTPEGGRVTLRAEHIKRGGSKVESRFLIADNGMGMSAEFMDKMYIPFEQENPSNGEGTGLGLPICKRLVELMGGKIECQSAVGGGTTFTVTLVNEMTDEEPVLECSAKAKTAAPNDSFKGKRILVCEDHPLNTQIAVKLLERAGCIVECAENGSVGVDKFSVSKAGYYSAVLMDIRMPVMNGLDAARAIRALDHPDAKRVPIIAMTANAFEEDVKKSRASGMNAHLSKPISPQVLYGTLAEFIT